MVKERKYIRIRNFDYSSEGAYFITFNVKNRLCILSNIIDEKVLLSEEQFQKIFQRTSSVSFDDYTVVCINEINGVFFYCNHRLRWLKAKESLW